MKKRVMIFTIILVNIFTLFAPLNQAKADTLDESEFWALYDYIATTTAEEYDLIMEKLGIIGGIAMSGSGYVDFTEDALRHIGNWCIDKMVKSVEYARLTGQWALDKYCDILDCIVGWDGNLTINDIDWRVVNSLYTDDDWSSLVSSWAQVTTPGDNFISFQDVTDDIEGYANEIYQSLDGTYQSNRLVDVQAMTVEQRTSWISKKPSTFNITTNNNLKYVYHISCLPTSKEIDYFYYKKYGAYYQPYFHYNDGTETQNINSVFGSNVQNSWLYSNNDVIIDGVAMRIYQWNRNNSPIYPYNPQSPAQFSASNGFVELTASTNLYQWYHQASIRVFNIPCYYSDDGGTTLIPFTVHPENAEPWTAPTQTPIIEDNNHLMYMNSNINSNWADLKDAILNNVNIIQNIGDGNTYIIVLPSPDFIEDPTEPEPVIITPTPTPTPTPEPIIYDVNIVSPLPLPVIIQEPSVTPPDPGWGLDLPNVDFELPEITIPDIGDLTTSANIEGTVLFKTLEAENENDEDITYANVTGWLFAGLPNNQMIWIWIFAFVCLVVTLLFRR